MAEHKGGFVRKIDRTALVWVSARTFGRLGLKLARLARCHSAGDFSLKSLPDVSAVGKENVSEMVFVDGTSVLNGSVHDRIFRQTNNKTSSFNQDTRDPRAMHLALEDVGSKARTPQCSFELHSIKPGGHAMGLVRPHGGEVGANDDRIILTSKPWIRRQVRSSTDLSMFLRDVVI